MEIKEETRKVNITAVVTYYLLACLFSWPFFWWRDMEPESWKLWAVPGFIKTASYMWGPGLSAIICLLIFRKSHIRRITFFGTSIVKSLLFWFIPIIPLAIFSLKGEEALILPFLGFFIILGEELGWRGFLQDALWKLPPFKRYLLIGIMWELWHFTNRMHNGFTVSTFIRVGIFMIVTTLLSFIMGRLTDRTKSLVIAVTIHSWIDILFEYSKPATYIIFGCSLFFWTYLIMTWGRPLNFKKRSLID